MIFNLWILAGFVIGVVGGLVIVFIDDVRLERRAYWATWLAGVGLMTIVVTQRSWCVALVAYAIAAGAGVLLAYFRTPYLKIGGQIYSFSIARTQPDPPVDGSPAPSVSPPPDSYRGQVTANAMWWLIATISVCAAVSALMLGMSGATLGISAFAVVMLAVAGYIDHLDGFPIARGQWLQAAVTIVASIPIFLLPPLAYVIAYYVDRPRRPAKPQSTE